MYTTTIRNALFLMLPLRVKLVPRSRYTFQEPRLGGKMEENHMHVVVDSHPERGKL